MPTAEFPFFTSCFGIPKSSAEDRFSAGDRPSSDVSEKWKIGEQSYLLTP